MRSYEKYDCYKNDRSKNMTVEKKKKYIYIYIYIYIYGKRINNQIYF
jgi:hypothetical protein